MKKLYFLSTVLFWLAAANGQVNIYFQNNPAWLVSSSCAVPLPCIQQESKYYYLAGDTIINSNTYKQVFKNGQGTYTWMAPPPVGCSGTYAYTDTTPAYFLRSAGQQMFLRQPADTSEYLLYDFNLSVGDTLPVTFNNPQSNIYVSGIDSIYTPYGYRKRFTLSGNTSAQYLIEGIGSTNGLVEPVSVVLECGYSLTCYSLNDTTYYPAMGPACILPAGLASVALPGGMSFYPNPFAGETTLYTPLPVKNATLTVYTAVGQICFQVKNISGQHVLLHCDPLPPGIYFARLEEHQQVIATVKLLATGR
jgi:hypothetical protein